MKGKAVAFFTFAIVLVFMLLVPLSAHRGKTDANGGHWDNSTGDYHYHCGGNPPHDHIGGRCPYDRVPADTPNYEDEYGNGTSVTRKEEPMDGWVIFLIILGGIVVIGIVWSIINKIKEAIERPRRQLLAEKNKLKEEIKKLKKENKELSEKQARLEKDNAELLKNISVYKDRVFSYQEENRKLRREINSVEKQIEENSISAINDETEELKKQIEKKEQRIDILETKCRDLELRYSGFREASLKKFKVEAWGAFFRKTERVLKNSYDFERFFDSAESGRLDSALADTVQMNNIEFYAEFEPHSDKTTDKYETSLNGCTCRDYKFSKDRRPCKHMLYLAYSIGALQLNAERFEKTKSRLIKAVRSNSLKNKVLIQDNKRLTKLIKAGEGKIDTF